MLKKIFGFALLSLVFGIGITYAAPSVTLMRTIFPETNNFYNLGSSTQQWYSIFTNSLCLNNDCKSAWPTSGGGGGGANTSTANYYAYYMSGTAVTGTPDIQNTATGPSFNNTTTFSGNVNIKTTNKPYALYVNGGVKIANGQWLSFGDSADADGLRIYTTAGQNIANINQANNADLSVLTNNKERMRFTNVGLIGINTSTPIALLSLQTTSTNPAFDITSSTGSSLFRVNNDGNVGIGSTTAFTKLDVRGSTNSGAGATAIAIDENTGYGFRRSSDNYLVSILNTSGVNGSRNVSLGITGGEATGGNLSLLAGGGRSVNYMSTGLFGVNTTSPKASLSSQSIAGSQMFDIASSSGMSLFRIDSAGNVGIGTTTPSYPLSVSGTTYISNFASGLALATYVNAAGDTWPIYTSNASASGGAGVQIDRTSNARNASIKLSLLGIPEWTIGETRYAGNTTNDFSISTSTDIAVVPAIFTISKTTGNVGVRTSTPISELSVVGGTYITGNITSSGHTLTNILSCNASNQSLQTGSNGDITCGTLSTGSSFVTTTINGVVTTTFAFTTSSDTNIGLSITTSSNQLLFNPFWIGTLADGRIASAATWNAKQNAISAGTNIVLTGATVSVTSTPTFTSSTIGTLNVTTCNGCGTGGGTFTTTTINGLVTTGYTFVGAGGLTITTSGPGTVTFTQTAGGGGGSSGIGTSTVGYLPVYNSISTVTGTPNVQLVNNVFNVNVTSTFVTTTFMGNVGINTSTPDDALAVRGIDGNNIFEAYSSTGASEFQIDKYGNLLAGLSHVAFNTSTTALGIAGTSTSFLELNLVNTNPGASGDLVTTADDGTASTWFTDMGINNSAYNDPTYSILPAHTSYLYNHGNGLEIGTASSSAPIIFFTGGTLVANERMRITDTSTQIINLVATNITSTNEYIIGNNIANGTSTLATSTISTLAVGRANQAGDETLDVLGSMALESSPGVDVMVANSSSFTVTVTSTLATTTINSRLGINTSTPSSLLSVKGITGVNTLSITSSSGASYLNIDNKGNIVMIPNATNAVYFGVVGDFFSDSSLAYLESTGGIFIDSDISSTGVGDVQIGNKAVPYLTVKNTSGFVGIGTDVPSTTLHVIGTMKVTGTSTLVTTTMTSATITTSTITTLNLTTLNITSTTIANLNFTNATSTKLVVNHLVGGTTAPTIATSTGAGTGVTSTAQIAGTDLAGRITVTTGAAPSVGATIATVTFNQAYPVACYPSLTAMASTSIGANVYASTTPTTLVLFSGGLGLSASTTYKWAYQCIQ